MNTQKYLTLINHPEEISFEDIELLEKLANEYPFSQSTHALLAKACSILEQEQAKEKVNKAAIYSVNRAVLKKFILKTDSKPETKTFQSDNQAKIKSAQQATEEVAKIETPEVVEPLKEASLSEETTKESTQSIQPLAVSEKAPELVQNPKEKTEKTQPEVQEDQQVEEQKEAVAEITDQVIEDATHEVEEQIANLSGETKKDGDAEEKTEKKKLSQPAEEKEEVHSKQASLNLPKEFEEEALEEIHSSQPSKTEIKHTFGSITINKKNQKSSITYQADSEEDDDFYKEIKANLERLKKQKAEFIAQDKAFTEKIENIHKSIEEVQSSSSSTKKKRSKTSASDSGQNDQSKTNNEADDQNDLLLGRLETLEEKKADKKQVSKQKEQFDLITKFIESNKGFARVNPSINSPSDEQEDLSSRYSEIGDHLISENLALIMIKQNKVEKAIDIYKKLIWKFPQKKAYFANRIEELKNNS